MGRLQAQTEGLRLSTHSSRSFVFFSSRRRHTRLQGDWSSDVCSSDLSAERLDRITSWLKDDSAKGAIPGAVLMILRHGKVAYFESMGVLDPETKAPMGRSEERRVGKECRSRWSPYH